MKVDANEVVHAIEVVENSKVDINIIREEVVPACIDKGKGKALKAIEEKENAIVSCVCFIFCTSFLMLTCFQNSPLHLKILLPLPSTVLMLSPVDMGIGESAELGQHKNEIATHQTSEKRKILHACFSLFVDPFFFSWNIVFSLSLSLVLSLLRIRKLATRTATLHTRGQHTFRNTAQMIGD